MLDRLRAWVGSGPQGRGLAARQARIVVLIAFGLGVGASVAQIGFDYLLQRDKLASTVDQLLVSIEAGAANALWELDGRSAESLARGLLAYQPVTAVSLVTNDGYVLADVAEPPPAEAITTEDRLARWLFGPTRSLKLALFYAAPEGDLPVGHLTVRVAPFPLAGEFLSRAAMIFGTGLVRSLIMAAILFAFFYATLTKPLSRLSQALAKIDPSDVRAAPLRLERPPRDDELDSLVADINTLLDVVRHQFAELYASQAALERLNASLETKVEARTAHLTREIESRMNAENQLRVALEQAHRNADTKSRILANVSHELRTPLNAIIGFSELIRDRGDALPAAKRQEYLEHVHGSGHALLGLVNQILALSRLNAGKMPLEVETIDLRQIIRATAMQLEPLASRNGNRLTLIMPDDVPAIVSDEGKISQILRNLIGNAAKFTENGRIAVSVDIVSGTPRPIRIRVEDDGLGMDEATLKTLFEPFSRGDEQVARKKEGAGLGLAIVRELCTLLDAEIGVRSAPGEGTSFDLALPLAVTPPDAIEPVSEMRSAR